MPRYVLDTNVYVRATRDEVWNQALESFMLAFTPEIWLHSVVALELLAGATSAGLARRTEERFIRPFERRGRVIMPSHEEWKRAGSELARLVRERRISPGAKITKSLVNDCIIAASARNHGFVLVTDNAKDFALIRDALPVEFVAPWPRPREHG